MSLKLKYKCVDCPHSSAAIAEASWTSRVMGEKNRRNKHRDHVFSTYPRCIYCSSASESIEHMPPVSMFKANDRPTGFEFGCCNDCNQGTKAADAVASYIGRICKPCNPNKEALHAELDKAERAILTFCPSLLDELYNREYITQDTYKMPDGSLAPVFARRSERGSTPTIDVHVNVFCAKMSMALHAHHFGRPLAARGRSHDRLAIKQ